VRPTSWRHCEGRTAPRGGAFQGLAPGRLSPDADGDKRSSVFSSKPAARKAAITFVAGAALLAGATAAVLTQAPPRVVLIGAPGVKALSRIGASGVYFTTGGGRICQQGEVLPRGVSAIRLSIWAFFGTPVNVTVYESSGRAIAEGSRNASWTSDSVTVPVKPLARTTPGVTLCFRFGPNSEPLEVLGPHTPPAQAAAVWAGGPGAERSRPSLIPGRVTVEYLAPGSGSWYSRILSTARRLGLGRAFSGTWIALLVAALMAGVCALAVGLALRDLSGGSEPS
jgi:hypothetical protein